MAGKTSNNGSGSNTASKKETKNVSWKKVVGVALVAVLLYPVVTMGYVFYLFMSASSGPYGATLAVTDEVSERMPLYFMVIQKMAVLPFPNHAAQKYYESQRESMVEAAKNFELHPYWFSGGNQATQDMDFREVVTERIRAMYRQLQQDGRMDYRIEKDRCAQFEFLKRNHIAHPKIQKTWYNKQELLDDVKSPTTIPDMMDHWPVFFKACHLTQRSSLGTFGVSSPEAFEQDKPELIDWIDSKWVYRARDVDRPWQEEGDALTDELTPSFIVQEPMIQTSSSDQKVAFELNGRVAMGLVEMKVEVIWGRVYLMQMDAITVFHRNGDTEDYSTFMGGVIHRPSEAPKERVSWIKDEGHLDCVIELAERVAHAAHIEYIRVDIFLDRGDPKGCQVNEVSLSSGYAYYGHEEYMAKLWAGPLHDKLYKVYNSTAPVYELTS